MPPTCLVLLLGHSKTNMSSDSSSSTDYFALAASTHKLPIRKASSSSSSDFFAKAASTRKGEAGISDDSWKTFIAWASSIRKPALLPKTMDPNHSQPPHSHKGNAAPAPEPPASDSEETSCGTQYLDEDYCPSSVASAAGNLICGNKECLSQSDEDDGGQRVIGALTQLNSFL
jgi:hypothetical protein